MKEPKKILNLMQEGIKFTEISNSFEEGMKSTQISTSNNLKEFAGTPQEEETIYNEAINNFRKKQYENFRREQYHTNYQKFADPDKESRLIGAQKITDFRYNLFEMYCSDSTQEDHIKFAGSAEEEKLIGNTAIIEFRRKKKAQQHTNDYWNRVRHQPTVSYKKYTTEEFFTYITTERAKEVFGTHEYGPMAGQSKFKLDFQSEPIIRALCEYFTSNPAFEKRYFEDPATKDQRFFSLDKGLLLFSECGYGKTDTMRLFARNPKQSFMIVNCLTVEEDFSIDGDENIRKYYTNLPNPNPQLSFGHTHFGVCFDNLGLEKDGKHYGSGENVMEKILFQRYHRRHELEGRTHITTNFSRAAIKERYGPAIYSRFYEMFNFLTFPSGSSDRRMQTT